MLRGLSTSWWTIKDIIALHTDCRVHAELYAFFNMWRHISPVYPITDITTKKNSFWDFNFLKIPYLQMHIRMEYFSREPNLRRLQRIRFGNSKRKLKHSTFIRVSDMKKFFLNSFWSFLHTHLYLLTKTSIAQYTRKIQFRVISRTLLNK